MSTVELKSSLHQLIDSIQNATLLESLHDILSQRKNSKAGALWNSLSDQQRNEVLEAFNESENSENLTPHSEVLKKFK